MHCYVPQNKLSFLSSDWQLDFLILISFLVGMLFDEVVYADDTILITTDTRAMNKFLANIETDGEQI